MKKTLIGLAVLSMTAFAGQPNIGGNAGNETNVFAPTLNQVGKIKVSVTLKSTTDVPKYVVYASETGTWDTTASDVLTLPSFIMSQSSITNIFDTDKPMQSIYIKKVTGADSVVDLTAETVDFKLVLDPAYTSLRLDWTSTSQTADPTALLSSSQLSTLASAVGLYTSSWGTISSSSRATHYRTPNLIEFSQKTKGVISIGTVTNNNWTSSSTFGKDVATQIESAIGTVGITTNTPYVLVKVK